MATIETSPEANCDRRTDRQDDKATYRGSSYRSAQKCLHDKYYLTNITWQTQYDKPNMKKVWKMFLDKHNLKKATWQNQLDKNNLTKTTWQTQLDKPNLQNQTDKPDLTNGMWQTQCEKHNVTCTTSGYLFCKRGSNTQAKMRNYFFYSRPHWIYVGPLKNFHINHIKFSESCCLSSFVHSPINPPYSLEFLQH